MSVHINVHPSIAILVLCLGLITYTLGEPDELNYCRTQGCQKTAKAFDKLIDWNASACIDFYQFACGRGPPEEFYGHQTQEEYLKNQIPSINFRERTTLTQAPSDSDPPVVQLMKRYHQSCMDQEALNAAGLKPVIKFLKDALTHQTWWELENWAVTIGLNSSLFSVEIVSHRRRRDKKGAIILEPPYKPIYGETYINISMGVIKKLIADGMDSKLATRLRSGLLGEIELYTPVLGATLSDEQKYDGHNLMRLSEWPVFWNKNRRVPENRNWTGYVDNYWINLVTSNVIVPLTKNGMFKTWFAHTQFIETLGRKIQDLGDRDLRNIILWRITYQLVQYAGKDTRKILGLPPIDTTRCATPLMKDVALNHTWWKIYPKSLRTPIRRMYANIDMQMKLAIYKKMPKIPKRKEALTPRERKKHDELYREAETVNKEIEYLSSQHLKAKAELKRISELSLPFWCSSPPGDDACFRLHLQYLQSRDRIPELETLLTALSKYISVKQEEKLRCEQRIKSFEDEHLGRPYADYRGTDWQRDALKFYVTRSADLAKFPYQNTFTQPAIIIRPPPHDESWVDLVLSFRRWERGTLLQEVESIRSVHDTAEFIINTISQEAFTRFGSDRPSSLNYGALGSVIGSQLWRKFIYFRWALGQPLGMMGTCLFRVSLASNPPKMSEIMEKTISVTNAVHGLEAAWNGFKRTVAIEGEHDVRLAKRANTMGDKISKLNYEKLFFLSFANTHCASTLDKTSQFFVDTALGLDPNFKQVFSCSRVSPGYVPEVCLRDLS